MCSLRCWDIGRRRCCGADAFLAAGGGVPVQSTVVGAGVVPRPTKRPPGVREVCASAGGPTRYSIMRVVLFTLGIVAHVTSRGHAFHPLDTPSAAAAPDACRIARVCPVVASVGRGRPPGRTWDEHPGDRMSIPNPPPERQSAYQHRRASTPARSRRRSPPISRRRRRRMAPVPPQPVAADRRCPPRSRRPHREPAAPPRPDRPVRRQRALLGRCRRDRRSSLRSSAWSA